MSYYGCGIHLFSGMRHLFDRLAAATCKQRFRPKQEIVVRGDDFFGLRSVKGKTDFVDRVINSGRPVGISYKARALGMLTDKSHATTIVGRQWNGKEGRCEFLVRNTWGKRCPPSSRWDCEDGYFRIPRDALMQQTFSAEYVD